MEYLIRPINQANAQAIVAWRYAEPFTIYNLPGIDVAAEIAYFLDPANCFHSVTDLVGNLIGFCSFGLDAQVPGGDYSSEALDIGLGLRPDLTGKGLGTTFLVAIRRFAEETFDPLALRATIARFNIPSRRIFEKNGFRIIDTFVNQTNPPLRFDVLLYSPVIGRALHERFRLLQNSDYPSA